MIQGFLLIKDMNIVTASSGLAIMFTRRFKIALDVAKSLTKRATDGLKEEDLLCIAGVGSSSPRSDTWAVDRTDEAALRRDTNWMFTEKMKRTVGHVPSDNVFEKETHKKTRPDCPGGERF